MFFTICLELVAKVQEEVWFLGMITVAEYGTKGSEYGVVVVGHLSAEESAVVEDIL